MRSLAAAEISAFGEAPAPTMPIVARLRAALDGRAVGLESLAATSTAGLSNFEGEPATWEISCVRRGASAGAELGVKLGAAAGCALRASDLPVAGEASARGRFVAAVSLVERLATCAAARGTSVDCGAGALLDAVCAAAGLVGASTAVLLAVEVSTLCRVGFGASLLANEG